MALQSGLDNFRVPLEEKGLRVVSMETAREPVNVIVYSGVSCEYAGISGVENFGSTMDAGETDRVLMINAVGMSPEEVRDLVIARSGVDNGVR